MLSRTERAIVVVSLFLAGPPTALAVLVAAGNLLALPERTVMYLGCAGLAAGVVLAAALLRRGAAGVYTLGKALTVPIYLLWSLMATAVFMGLPIGLVAVGALAGLYVGRRSRHAAAPEEALARSARQVGLLTAAVTGLIALAMGVLAVGEQRSMQGLLGLVGLAGLAATAAGRAVLVAVAVPALAAVQFGLTRRAALWAYRLGRGGAPAAPA